MLHSLGEWSSKRANGLIGTANHYAADALSVAAKKMQDLSVQLQKDTIPADQTLCHLIDGEGTAQDFALQRFFDTVAATKDTPYLTISIMGSQNGGKSTMLN